MPLGAVVVPGEIRRGVVGVALRHGSSSQGDERMAWTTLTRQIEKQFYCDFCRKRQAKRCKPSGELGVRIFACMRCYRIDLGVQAMKDQHEAYIAEFGYPAYWSFEEGLRRIRDTARRLRKLKKLNPPACILRDVRHSLVKYTRYMRQYLKSLK